MFFDRLVDDDTELRLQVGFGIRGHSRRKSIEQTARRRRSGPSGDVRRGKWRWRIGLRLGPRGRRLSSPRTEIEFPVIDMVSRMFFVAMYRRPRRLYSNRVHIPRRGPRPSPNVNIISPIPHQRTTLHLRLPPRIRMRPRPPAMPFWRGRRPDITMSNIRGPPRLRHPNLSLELFPAAGPNGRRPRHLQLVRVCVCPPWPPPPLIESSGWPPMLMSVVSIERLKWQRARPSEPSIIFTYRVLPSISERRVRRW